MELDFTGLNNLRQTKEEQREEKPTADAGKSLEESLKALQQLQREAGVKREIQDKTLEIYKEQQKNIKQSSQLQTEIIKGATAGESIYSLFLKACKAVSLMTSDPLFYDQLEADVRAVYGYGFSAPEAIQIEKEKVGDRLQHLKQAMERETEPETQRIISRAIKSNEKKMAELEELIQKERRTS